MPTIQCPECGVEFSHLGHRTGVECPNPTCDEVYIPVGGPAKPREGAGFSITDVRDRLAERRGRTTPP